MTRLQPKPRWDENKKEWKLCVYEGTKRIKSFTTKDFKKGEEDCIKKYKAWLASGKKKIPNNVNTLWEQYIETCKNTYCSRAIQNKISIYTQYIKPMVGSKKSNAVSVQDFQDIIDKSYRNGKGLSRKMLINVKNEIYSFCHFCERKGITIVLPELSIPKNARAKGKKIIPDIAIRELFNPKYDNYLSINYFRLMMLLGCRPGEVAGLQWGDLDKDHLTINRSINLQGDITQGKNEHALRTIILSDFALNVLEKQRDWQTKEGITTDWIFGYDADKQPSLHRLYKRWCGVSRGKGTTPTPGLAELLGAKGTSLYSFRHTFVTLCQEANVDLSVLKPFVGHSFSMDTYGTYSHTTDIIRKKASQDVDRAIKSKLCS